MNIRQHPTKAVRRKKRTVPFVLIFAMFSIATPSLLLCASYLLNKNDIEATVENSHLSSSILKIHAEPIKKAEILHHESARKLPKVLAVYFPQYHKEPLNDEHWGENFTDWTSLKNAPRRNKAGFTIPRPTELGYYDLKDTEPRRKQGELAKQYGIDGFIFHHYWFYDQRHPGPNLAVPLLNLLSDGHPDVPFFLNWCAVKWINVWMGKTKHHSGPISMNRAKTIQEQYFNATEEMIHEHYVWLARFFHHPNYIRIDSQPVLLFYFWDERASFILQRLREYAKQDGFRGLYLIVGRAAPPEHLFDPEKETDERLISMMKRKVQSLDLFPVGSLFNQSMTYPYPHEFINRPFQVPKWCTEHQKPPSPSNRPEINGVLTTFDNTPRREFKYATLYNVFEPEKVVERFRANLEAAVYFETCCRRPMPDGSFVVVNAWNEWAEGMALEPSNVYGRRLLEVVRDVKAKISQYGCSNVTSVASLRF